MVLVVDRNIVIMVAHATTMGAEPIVDGGWGRLVLFSGFFDLS